MLSILFILANILAWCITREALLILFGHSSKYKLIRDKIIKIFPTITACIGIVAGIKLFELRQQLFSPRESSYASILTTEISSFLATLLLLVLLIGLFTVFAVLVRSLPSLLRWIKKLKFIQSLSSSSADKELRVSFYIVPHPDDWQIFMSPSAYEDLQSYNNQVIFIYVTDGDSGEGRIWSQARIQGALRSIQFATQDVQSSLSIQSIEYNEHLVMTCDIRNSRSIFMRIPDGNGDGSGWQNNNYQSLSQLHENKISTLQTAIEETTSGLSSYQSWQDFTDTLFSIIKTEIERFQFKTCSPKHISTCVNFLDPFFAEHSDHYEIGRAMEEILKNHNLNCKIKKYLDYSVIDKPANVSAEALPWKIAVYSTYFNEVHKTTGGSYPYPSQTTWQWIQRQYLT
jgi:hypothetical protein